MKKIISVTLAVAMLAIMLVSVTACAASPAAVVTSAPAPATAAPVASATVAPVATASPAPTTTGDFKVGLECNYAPYNWTQPTNVNGAVPILGTNEFAGGYDIEIAKQIAAGLGKNLVIVKMQWDGLIPAVEAGTIDAIIAGMSPIPDRRQVIDFTDYYYTPELVMVVKKGGKFENATSIQDFAGAKITAQLDTLHYTVIDQIKGVKKQTAMDDFPGMRVALQAGTIDGYVSEKPEGTSATAANSAFAMVQFAQGNGFTVTADESAIAIGLIKGSSLTPDINKILASISESQRKQIMDTAIQQQPAAN